MPNRRAGEWLRHAFLGRFHDHSLLRRPQRHAAATCRARGCRQARPLHRRHRRRPSRSARARRAGMAGAAYSPCSRRRSNPILLPLPTPDYAKGDLPPLLDWAMRSAPLRPWPRCSAAARPRRCGRYLPLPRDENPGRHGQGHVLAASFHIEGRRGHRCGLSSRSSCFYAAGLRSIGITWSRENIFGTGVPFRHDMPIPIPARASPTRARTLSASATPAA